MGIDIQTRRAQRIAWHVKQLIDTLAADQDPDLRGTLEMLRTGARAIYKAMTLPSTSRLALEYWHKHYREQCQIYDMVEKQLFNRPIVEQQKLRRGYDRRYYQVHRDEIRAREKTRRARRRLEELLT